jgi:hypothetical protein
MSKKSRKNHQADIKNPNEGTSGTNKTWDKAQGNKGKQMNPNQKSQPNKPVQKCPICHASVKANNMERHLLDVHEVQGEIERVWQEHNIYDEDDEKGMKIHINFNVDNLEEVDCCIAAYFSFQGGETIGGINDDFMTTDGQAVVGEDFTPSYEGTRYDDLQLFMPYEELNLAEGYHHHCEFEIQIYIDNTNVVLAESQPFRFSYQKSIHCAANLW